MSKINCDFCLISLNSKQQKEQHMIKHLNARKMVSFNCICGLYMPHVWENDALRHLVSTNHKKKMVSRIPINLLTKYQRICGLPLEDVERKLAVNNAANQLISVSQTPMLATTNMSCKNTSPSDHATSNNIESNKNTAPDSTDIRPSNFMINLPFDAKNVDPRIITGNPYAVISDLFTDSEGELIEDRGKCQICREGFIKKRNEITNRAVFNCGHIYCIECMGRQIYHDQSQGRKYEDLICGICRGEVFQKKHFHVEKIVEDKVEGDTVLFRVKYRGYTLGDGKDDWLSFSDLIECKELLNVYMKKKYEVVEKHKKLVKQTIERNFRAARRQ